jgi:hypothetical protein
MKLASELTKSASLNDPTASIKALVFLTSTVGIFETGVFAASRWVLYIPLNDECNVKFTRPTENFSIWGKILTVGGSGAFFLT